MESKNLLPIAQAVALALATTGGLQAATITVTDSGDGNGSGTCTLRQAIQSANTDTSQGTCTAGSGADTITFAPALANSTIALQYGQLLVYSSVTISGSGQSITAAPDSRVMSINSYGNSAPIVNLTDMTVTGGNYNGAGAGLLISYSTAPLRPSTQPRRHAQQSKAPAAPPSYAPVVSLDQVTISNNTSNTLAGGLFIDSATATINQSTVSGNSLIASGNYGAGGVYITQYGNYGSAVTITDSTISGNRVSGNHSFLTGGVYVYNSDLTVTNSTITGNSANGTADLAGGISLDNSSAGIYDSTVTGNQAAPANVATGGILVDSRAELTISNTILAGNTQLNVALQSAPTLVLAQPDLFTANGNVIAQSNLFGTALQATYTGNGNVFNDAPGLGALANNGGPTQTMKPQAGSPALGAGNVALIPAGVTTDQRGTGYTRVVSNSLDLGSVEAAAAPAAAATTPTPALSHWAMLALAGLLGLLGLRKRRDAS